MFISGFCERSDGERGRCDTTRVINSDAFVVMLYTYLYRDAVLLLEEHCDHSVVAFDLCAICGLNLKR